MTNVPLPQRQAKPPTDPQHAAAVTQACRLIDYTQADQRLGMPVKTYRRGGAQETIRFAVGESSLGAILVAATQKGICAIWLDDSPKVLVDDLQQRFPAAQLIGADEEFEQWVATVIGFIEAPQLGLALPLDIRGTAFQQRVWQALRDIPFGTTVSYSEIAAKIGSSKSVRAVASACAANAIAVAIPCHRVVRINGDLSGYRWGIERKRELLQREKHENRKHADFRECNQATYL